jgi:hypothetical protein
MGMASEKLGGSVQGTQAAIERLGTGLASMEKHGPRWQRTALSLGMALGGTGKAAQALGEKMFKGKGPIEAMDMLAEKMQGKNFIEAKASLGRLGLDDGQIRMIIQGKEAMHELVEENRKYTATDEDLEKSQAMEETMKNLKFSMEKVATTLAQFLLPALKWVGDAFLKISDWAAEHPAQLKSALMALGAAMLFLSASTIAAIGPAIGLWMAHNVGAMMATASFLMVKAAAIAMWLATLGPVGWAAVAFLAIVAAIGLLAIKFQWARDILVAGWSYIRTILVAVWDMIKYVFDAISAGLDLIVGIFTFNGDKIKGAWSAMCGAINSAFKKLGAILVFYVLTMAVAIVETFHLLWDALKGPAQSFFDWIGKKFEAVAKVFKAIAAIVSGGNAQTGEQGPQRARNEHEEALVHDTHVPTSTSAPSLGTAIVQSVAAKATKPASAATYSTQFVPIKAASVAPPSASPVGFVPATGPVNAPKIGKSNVSSAEFDAAMEAHHVKRMAASDAVKPSTVNNTKNAPVTTTSTVHVDTINVNAPQANDAAGVASGITGAIKDAHSDLVNQADGGMA